MDTVAWKRELQQELTFHKQRCRAIENLLRGLDDYEHPLADRETVFPPQNFAGEQTIESLPQ